MKAASLAVSVVSCLLLLSACETGAGSRQQSNSRPPHPRVRPSPAPTSTPAPTVAPEATPTPSSSPEASTPTPSPSPTPATTGGTTGTIPYGVPVPGKPGFVTSPYAPASGYIDVRGFPPNTEAKDPYTGKIFRVP